MKHTNYFILLFMVFICSFMLFACKKAPTTAYTGHNKIYIEAEGEPELIEGSKNEIKVILRATNKVEKDCHFEPVIQVLNGTDNNTVSVKAPGIVLKKGERETSFYIKLNEDVLSSINSQQFELSFKKFPEPSMSINTPFRFRVVNVQAPVLTEKQKELLNGYKRSKGIDLYPFMKKIKVKAHVKVPPQGLIAGFIDPWEKTYEGYSIITLSDAATAHEPVLKMTYNPMGMNDFFYYALRKNTIENYEFWFAELAGPMYKVITTLINWNDKSLENFSSSLDGIRVQNRQSNGRCELQIVADTMRDQYNYPIKALPFSFSYTAWDRQKALIEQKNLTAIQCHEEGASAAPFRYLNIKDIVNTEGEFNQEPSFKDNKGELSADNKKIQFSFLTYIEHAGSYIEVRVSYSLD